MPTQIRHYCRVRRFCGRTARRRSYRRMSVDNRAMPSRSPFFRSSSAKVLSSRARSVCSAFPVSNSHNCRSISSMPFYLPLQARFANPDNDRLSPSLTSRRVPRPPQIMLLQRRSTLRMSPTGCKYQRFTPQYRDATFACRARSGNLDPELQL